jgi:predicted ABC-type ATPase
MNDAPWLWLIGGPNGGGKSTYAPSLAARVEEIVRPDEIAERLAARPLFARNAAAGRLAIRRIQTLFRERRSFAVETTLAGRSYPRLLVRAKSEGWSTGIAYVGVATPDLAIERVRERVSRGGHDVPPMDVRRRYQRSLINLVRISKSVDRLVVLDNSSVDTPMQRVLESQNGVVAFALDQLPEWVEQVRDAILAP